MKEEGASAALISLCKMTMWLPLSKIDLICGVCGEESHCPPISAFAQNKRTSKTRHISHFGGGCERDARFYFVSLCGLYLPYEQKFVITDGQEKYKYKCLNCPWHMNDLN